MEGAVFAFIVLIVIGAIAIYQEKNGSRNKMRKCMNDPFYAYFFEDLKDFKNLARINGYDYWHNKEEDCIIQDSFDDEDMRRKSRYLTPTGEEAYFASEVLNLYVYFTSSEKRFYRDWDSAFQKKLMNLALEHLKRFNRDEWVYPYGRCMDVLQRTDIKEEE